MITPEKAAENIARAEDLKDLLDHIAWEQTIVPELNKYKDNYQSLLVNSVLGQTVVDMNTGTPISKEMLAGRIEGINWIQKFLLNVIKRGDISLDSTRYNLK